MKFRKSERNHLSVCIFSSVLALTLAFLTGTSAVCAETSAASVSSGASGASVSSGASAASDSSGASSASSEDSSSAQEDGKILLLHTNDVHCAVDQTKDSSGNVTGLGYAALASYKKKMIAEYGTENVTLLDAGDSIQGGSIGTLSSGSWIINIMNRVGYDLAVPGNHEFDFGLSQFLNLTKMASFPYLSCNLTSKADGKRILDAYKILSYGDTKIAYVGISTPESITKSTPAYFQDENGNYLYSFAEDSDGTSLYKAVQTAVDSAKAEGADYVVAVGHLGEKGITDCWTGTSVIANTTGIDILIDGHSHEEIEDTLENKDGKKVVHAQTGTKLTDIGKIVIDTKTGNISQELVKDYTEQDPEVLTYISSIEDQFKGKMEEKIGSTDYALTTKDSAGNRAVRTAETNLGDLCADAYREVLGGDIGLCNGGGIRSDLEAGDISVGGILNVYPFGSDTCIISASGQQILDALELSACVYPKENGGFLQVSGLTYTIDASVPSSVKRSDSLDFLSVDGPRRVKDVLVGGTPIDAAKMYKVAGSTYGLQQGGDGYSMFKNCEVISTETMKDYETLKNYIQTNLNGSVGTEYSSPEGQGRIAVLGTASSEPAGTASAGSSYTVQKGDWLCRIASSVYGDGSLWKKIYEANTGIIADPDLIYAGQELKIPAA